MRQRRRQRPEDDLANDEKRHEGGRIAQDLFGAPDHAQVRIE
ncbi:MAG: hypothetical protein ACAH24_24725 [Hyphomicrobiaceae bacterium]